VGDRENPLLLIWPVQWIFGCALYSGAGNEHVRAKISYFFASGQFECSKSKKIDIFYFGNY
jgi:hypothetical protein